MLAGLRRYPLLSALFLSGTAHAASAFGIAAAPAPAPSDGDGHTALVELEVEVVEEPAPELEVEPLPMIEPETPVLPLEPPRPRLATVVRPATVTETVTVEEEPTREQREPETPEREREREGTGRPVSRVSLDPSAVALGALTLDGPVDAPVDAPETMEERGRRIGDALSAGLAAEANARPWLSERPPPELRPRADGSYVYESEQFDAVIAPDGTVSFDRAAPVEMEGSFPVAGRFDLMDELERARGNEPYRHERAWFMRETRQLRERLEARWDRNNDRRALAGLDDRLLSLWRSDRPAAERRARLFGIWADCSQDAVGRAAREQILDFIRRRLPHGSRHAFGAAELTRLNRSRPASDRFDPYGPAAD